MRRRAYGSVEVAAEFPGGLDTVWEMEEEARRLDAFFLKKIFNRSFNGWTFLET